jgi:hypothetical protein
LDFSVAIEFVDKKIEAMKLTTNTENKGGTRSLSLLEQYLAVPDLDRKDVIGMVVDMLLAGADTVNLTLLYCCLFSSEKYMPLLLFFIISLKIHKIERKKLGGKMFLNKKKRRL